MQSPRPQTCAHIPTSCLRLRLPPRRSQRRPFKSHHLQEASLTALASHPVAAVPLTVQATSLTGHEVPCTSSPESRLAGRGPPRPPSSDGDACQRLPSEVLAGRSVPSQAQSAPTTGACLRPSRKHPHGLTRPPPPQLSPTAAPTSRQASLPASPKAKCSQPPSLLCPRTRPPACLLPLDPTLVGSTPAQGEPSTGSWLTAHELIGAVDAVMERIALLLDEDALATGAPELVGQADGCRGRARAQRGCRA